jgi:DNA repair protein RadA/Sms
MPSAGCDHRTGRGPGGGSWPWSRRCATRRIPHKLAVFGEIGLSGEIRPVQRGQERLKEATKLGFNRILAPKANLPKQVPAGVEVRGVVTLSEALDYLRELG